MMMSHDLFIVYLRDTINRDHGGSQASAAGAWGVSRPYLNEILHGTRKPATKLLDAIGWQRVTLYAAKDEGKRV